MELTEALKQYATEKVEALEKFIPEPTAEATDVVIELGKMTNHHTKGPVFVCEVRFKTPRKSWIAQDTTEDLYASIDSVVHKLKRQMTE